MSELGFFDTNVLLCMYDDSNEVKCQASIDLFHRSIDATLYDQYSGGAGVLRRGNPKTTP